jgi:YbbR domain-containing protein
MQSKSKLLTILFSVFVAAALWLYVVTVENPEITATISNIPVTYSGLEALSEDRGLLITSGLDATVTLRITGKRAEINKLTKDNITILADVSRVTRAQTYTLTYTVEYPSEVNSSSFQIDSKLPTSLSLTVERLATKQVEVRGELIGGTADGFTTETMTFDYDEITISGSEELVSQVSYALVTLERTNLDKTVTTTLPYTLMNSDNEPVDATDLTSDVTEIEVTLPVVKYKQIPLCVGFIAGGGATEEDVVCSIEPSSVTVSGDASVLDMVNQINLGNIDLGSVVRTSTFEYSILLPNNVKSVSGEETATVTIEISGLETKILRLSSIEIPQAPDGFAAEAVTQSVSVTIRASADDIDDITEANVHAIADMSSVSANAGTYTVPLTIEIYGYPDAGVIGTYSAVITLTESIGEESPTGEPSTEGDG